MRRQHDVTVAASLALLDADDHAAAVDVADLEAGCFRRAQSGGIGRGQRGTSLQAGNRFKETQIVSGIRAILPLVVFLFLVLSALLREGPPHRSEIFLGIAFTIIGMCIFNIGLTYGLSKLGGSAGGLVPVAFMKVAGFTDSPLYVYAVGLSLALLLAWALGFGATVAEPALNALGITAEQLTNGVFKKRTLILSVSTGVAFGIALGLLKLIFDLPLVYTILPGYRRRWR